jgi:hypothetical protein
MVREAVRTSIELIERDSEIKKLSNDFYIRADRSVVNVVQPDDLNLTAFGCVGAPMASTYAPQT